MAGEVLNMNILTPNKIL